VGSTNLNVASWIGNYELDVAIEDVPVARAMAEMYEQDLSHATEIVLDRHSRVRAARQRRRVRRLLRPKGTAVRAAAGALRIGHTVGAAITNRRVLGRTEGGIMAVTGAVLLGLVAVGIVWPAVLAAPIVLLAGWVGIALVVRAIGVYRFGKKPRSDENKQSKLS
jgi:cardiolipin synthase